MKDGRFVGVYVRVNLHTSSISELFYDPLVTNAVVRYESTLISLDATIIKALPLSLPNKEIAAVVDCTGLARSCISMVTEGWASELDGEYGEGLELLGAVKCK